MNANTVLNYIINATSVSMQSEIATLSNTSVYGNANNKMNNLQMFYSDKNKYIVCDDFVCEPENGENNQICK